MTLTTWAGGYRASTRGCSNAPLQTISAWNMEGGQVQLLNDAGATVARLYPVVEDAVQRPDGRRRTRHRLPLTRRIRLLQKNRSRRGNAVRGVPT